MDLYTYTYTRRCKEEAIKTDKCHLTRGIRKNNELASSPSGFITPCYSTLGRIIHEIPFNSSKLPFLMRTTVEAVRR